MSEVMMKKIFFTGGSGFLGRNLLLQLAKKYKVFAPNRAELNLIDAEALEEYIRQNRFDVVIHAAVPNLAFSREDRQESFFKASMIPFLIFDRLQDYYGKMIYFGSGAEFGKQFPIVRFREEDFGRRIPDSEYGLAKYVMNVLCRRSRKIYNLRIFGCYGPTDADFKLITSVIRACLEGRPIRLHQNCIFDFMHVHDLLPVLEFFIEHTPKYHDYNVCTGIQAELLEICNMVQNELHTNLPVLLEKEGWNNEYSGDNSRLCREFSEICFTPLAEGIRKQIEFERSV